MTDTSANGHVPFIKINLDRERRWQLDVAALERACDGFDEVGLPKFADNPVVSLKELGEDAKNGLKINRTTSKIFRVWLWAGLTTEDPALTLADVTAKLSVGKMPRLLIEVLPVLMDSIVGPLEAAPDTKAGDAATGPSGESV